MITKKAVILALVSASLLGVCLSANCVYPLLEIAFDDVGSQQLQNLLVKEGSWLLTSGGVNITCLDARGQSSTACLDRERCIDFMVKYCRRIQINTEMDGTRSISCDSRFRLSDNPGAVTNM